MSSDDDIEILLWCYKNYKSLFKLIIFNHSRWWINLQLFPLKYFDEFLSNPKGWIIEEYIKKCFQEQEMKRLRNISKIQKKLFYEYLLDDIWTYKKGSNYINFIGFCYNKNKADMAKKYFPELFDQQDFTKYLSKITRLSGCFFNYEAPILKLIQDFNIDKSIINTEIGNILDNCICSHNYDYVKLLFRDYKKTILSQVTQNDINQYIYNLLDDINCSDTNPEDSLNNIKILELIHTYYSNLSININKLRRYEIICNPNNHNFTSCFVKLTKINLQEHYESILESILYDSKDPFNIWTYYLKEFMGLDFSKNPKLPNGELLYTFIGNLLNVRTLSNMECENLIEFLTKYIKLCPNFDITQGYHLCIYDPKGEDTIKFMEWYFINYLSIPILTKLLNKILINCVICDDYYMLDWIIQKLDVKPHRLRFNNDLLIRFCLKEGALSCLYYLVDMVPEYHLKPYSHCSITEEWIYYYVSEPKLSYDDYETEMLKYPDPIYNYSNIPSSYSPTDFDEDEILQYDSDYEFDDVRGQRTHHSEVFISI